MGTVTPYKYLMFHRRSGKTTSQVWDRGVLINRPRKCALTSFDWSQIVSTWSHLPQDRQTLHFRTVWDRAPWYGCTGNYLGCIPKKWELACFKPEKEGCQLGTLIPPPVFPRTILHSPRYFLYYYVVCAAFFPVQPFSPVPHVSFYQP